MRVLVAPDAFTGTLSAAQAATAIADGWRAQAPGDEVTACPLSAGGPGFVDVLLTALGGDLVPVTVQGPDGAPVPATLLVHTPAGARPTAYVEAAQACGRHLTDDPAGATSHGVGELLRAAVDAGAGRVVVATGGLGSHDGGAGALAALGAGPAERLGRGGAALQDLPDDALAGLAGARALLRDVDLVVATDTDLPLLGFHGASATEAEGRGATPAQAQQLEAALGRFAQVAEASLVAGRSLTGTRTAQLPGAGAGGGLAYALLLLGARRAPAVDVVLAAVGFEDRLAATDLVVTGESVFGFDSLRDAVVAAVAATAAERGLPVVVLAEQVEVGRREAMSIGVSGSYAVHDRGGARLEPAAALAARAARVARTWSR